MGPFTCGTSWAQEYKIMTEELKPFGYVDNGEIKGVCVEIVREVLKVVGPT